MDEQQNSGAYDVFYVMLVIGIIGLVGFMFMEAGFGGGM